MMRARLDDSAWGSALFTSGMRLDGFETREERRAPATKIAGLGVDAPLKNAWRVVALGAEVVDGTGST